MKYILQILFMQFYVYLEKNISIKILSRTIFTKNIINKIKSCKNMIFINQLQKPQTMARLQAGVTITAKDRSFIWLLNGIFFYETRWHDLYPLPIHTLTVASREILSCPVKEVLKKFCALYIKMSVTCCGDVLNPSFRKQIISFQ